MKKILLLFFVVCLLQCSLLAPKAKAQVNVQDSLALLALYNSTNGPNWLLPWPLNLPINQWNGVNVLNGRVIGLQLYNDSLNGTIPPEIGNLTELVQLHLGYNQLHGTIPACLYSLNKLEMLHLGENQLYDTLSSLIGNLVNLKYLYLGINNFYGVIPNELCNLTNLLQFDINNNNFTGSITTSFYNLTELTLCRFDGNHFSSIISFYPLTQQHLNGLAIHNNSLTFEDIEPNMTLLNIISFTYYPQDSVYFGKDTSLLIGSNFVISSKIGGSYNKYQWFKNGDTIPGATDTVLVLLNISLADSGVYTCNVTNDSVPGLTINRRPVSIHVTDTLQGTSYVFSELNQFYISHCGNNTIEIVCPDITGSFMINIHNAIGEKIIAFNIAIPKTHIQLPAPGMYIITLQDPQYIKSYKILNF